MNDWQYTNQFFMEGQEHYSNGGSIKDCPYNYLDVDQSDEKQVQNEHYRQREWIEGFKCQHSLHKLSQNCRSA